MGEIHKTRALSKRAARALAGGTLTLSNALQRGEVTVQGRGKRAMAVLRANLRAGRAGRRRW